MVGRCDNRDQNPAGICNGKQNVEQWPGSRFPRLSWLEGVPEDSGMIEQGATYAEGISKVHRGHSGQGVHVFAFHPDTLCVIVANAIEEAVFFGEQSRWHAWVEDEDRKCKEIRKSHGPSNNCEGVE